MPLILKTQFPPTYSGPPPHMAREDLTLWEQARKNLIKEAINLYFDVGLGGQAQPPPDTTPEMAKMWLYNTQKRIDVLIETKTHWKLIELRPNASSTAIGRILQYKLLWDKEAPDKKPTELIIITNRLDPDLLPLAQQQNVNLIIYEHTP